jgi:hypothetical protein
MFSQLRSPKQSSKISNAFKPNEHTGPDVRDCLFLPTNEDLKYQCRLCPETKILKQKHKTDYCNLFRHVKDVHSSNWVAACDVAKSEWKSSGKGTLKDFGFTAIDERSKSIHDWIEFIMTNNLPLTFCDSTYNRSCVIFSKISYKTLKRYMTFIRDEIVKKLAEEFKEKILGIVFDGWSDGHGSHYTALFIVYSGNDGSYVSRLIAVAPLLDETTFDANCQMDFINSSLQFYGLKANDISFLVGDNCQVNLSMSKKLRIPLVGCASHRFNLAMVDYFKDYEEILSNINEIMKKLNNLKNSGKLREYTNLKPLTRNVTRWSSTKTMLIRFLKLHDANILSRLTLFDNTITGLMPNRAQVQNLKALGSNLRKS